MPNFHQHQCRSGHWLRGVQRSLRRVQVPIPTGAIPTSAIPTSAIPTVPIPTGSIPTSGTYCDKHYVMPTTAGVVSRKRATSLYATNSTLHRGINF